jgi:HEAT repeat protein
MRPSIRATLCLAALWCLCAACGEPHEIPTEDAARVKALFLEGLGSSEPAVRLETVRALGLTGSVELRELLRVASKDPDVAVRHSAAALLFAQTGECKPMLVAALTGEDERLRRAAARELIRPDMDPARLQEFVTLALRSRDPVVLERAVRVGVLPRVQGQGQLDREAMTLLLRLVEEGDVVTAGVALQTLKRAGRDDLVADLLQQARKGPSVEERRRAIQVLTEVGEPTLKPALDELVQGPEGKLRQDAALGLASLGELGRLDEVRTLLKGADEETTTRALRHLAANPSRDIYLLLKTSREDSRPGVRAASYAALARHPEAKPADFRRGLTDPDPSVPPVALRALLTSRPGALAETLSALMKDPNEVERGAVGLLSALDSLKRDQEAEHLKALRGQLLRLTPDLVLLLKSPSSPVRAAAAELLFERPDPLGFFEGIESRSPEIVYAVVDRLAQEPNQDPLGPRGWLVEQQGHPLVLVRILSGAALWRAYLVAAPPA